MATISSGLTRIIVGLSDLFSKRAWPLVQLLLAGAILAVGPRTIGAVLRVTGLSKGSAIPEILHTAVACHTYVIDFFYTLLVPSALP